MFHLNFLRIFAMLLIFLGLGIVFYVSFPLISWHVYFTPTLTEVDVTAPIPKTTVVTRETVKTLVMAAKQNMGGTDYYDAQNWFPSYQKRGMKIATKQKEYVLSIPKLGITRAIVSTEDYDLSRHLVHYGGTSLPPDNGNTVVFGHSTLPQLFNPNDYTTIFANAYKLGINDEIIATLQQVSYRYKIKTILIVNPTETSIFSQDFDSPYITLVTCTPPGTTWKRLIIRGKLEKI